MHRTVLELWSFRHSILFAKVLATSFSHDLLGTFLADLKSALHVILNVYWRTIVYISKFYNLFEVKFSENNSETKSCYYVSEKIIFCPISGSGTSS